MSASRTAAAVLLAVTYLSTATAALPAVCAVSCAADAGPKGTVCHRAARAEAGTSCHRAKPVARCPMHESRDASGRCCAMSGDRQQAEHLLLSLMSAAFPVPEPVDLLQAPSVSRLEGSDHICECCRLAVAFDDRKLPIVAWRDIFEGSIRDHALLRFASADEPGESVRVTFDGWGIEACPHHGPSLSLDGNGTYHLVWFTGEGPQGPGAFYATSADGGRTFSQAQRLGGEEAIGHAAVTVVGPKIYVVWKEFTESAGMAIRAMEGEVGRSGWSPAWTVAETGAGSDHPLLVTLGSRVFLSWFTTGESYRLVELRPEAAQGTR